MTPRELLALCAESERDGVDYVVIKVATRREPGSRMRILPGVLAEVLETGRGYAVVRAPARKVREVVLAALAAHVTDRSESDEREDDARPGTAL